MAPAASCAKAECDVVQVCTQACACPPNPRMNWRPEFVLTQVPAAVAALQRLLGGVLYVVRCGLLCSVFRRTDSTGPTGSTLSSVARNSPCVLTLVLQWYPPAGSPGSSLARFFGRLSPVKYILGIERWNWRGLGSCSRHHPWSQSGG